MTNQEFINIIAPISQKLFNEGSKIFPSIRIAQSALESGWKIPSWNNVVGLKVGDGKINDYWKGRYVTKDTWEMYDGTRKDVQANFRAYDSIENCFKDQDLLFALSRYQRVREAKTPEEQAQALLACGYATDPQYAHKLLAIVAQYQLKKYDKGEEQMEPKEQPVSTWAKEAWEWAIKENLTDGKNPKEPITREQMVTILYRYHVKQNVNNNKNPS